MINEANKFEPYSLVWPIFSATSPVPMPLIGGGMGYYNPADEINFPIYLSGKTHEYYGELQFDLGTLAPINMSAGALLGCTSPRYHMPIKPVDLRPMINDYLEQYSKKLGFENLDNMVLEISAILRGKNGPSASARALKNSEHLKVNFHKILNDLLLDLWKMLPFVEEKNLSLAFIEFYSYLSKVKEEGIHPGSLEWLSYVRSITLLYLVVTNTFDIDPRELTAAIYKNKNPQLRDTLIQLWGQNKFDMKLL